MHTRSKTKEESIPTTSDIIDEIEKTFETVDIKEYLNLLEESKSDLIYQQNIDKLCELAVNPEIKVEDIKNFLKDKDKFDINGLHSKGQLRPVDLAARNGNEHVLKYFITSLFADLDYSQAEENIVELAMQNENVNVLKYVLSIPELPSSMNDGTTQLHLDALAGLEQKVHATLEQHPEELVKTNNTNLTILWWADSPTITEFIVNFSKTQLKIYSDNQKYEEMADIFKMFALSAFLDDNFKIALAYMQPCYSYLQLAYRKNINGSPLAGKICDAALIRLKVLAALCDKEKSIKERLFSLKMSSEFIFQNLEFIEQANESFQLNDYHLFKDKFLLKLVQIASHYVGYVNHLLNQTWHEASSLARTQECYEFLSKVLTLSQQLSDEYKKEEQQSKLKKYLSALNEKLNTLHETDELEMFDKNLFSLPLTHLLKSNESLHIPSTLGLTCPFIKLPAKSLPNNKRKENQLNTHENKLNDTYDNNKKIKIEPSAPPKEANDSNIKRTHSYRDLQHPIWIQPNDTEMKTEGSETKIILPTAQSFDCR